MTDKIHALTVALDTDIRDDEVEPLIAAIKQLRGVLGVKQHIANVEDYSARERIRYELGQKLWDVLRPRKNDQ